LLKLTNPSPIRPGINSMAFYHPGDYMKDLPL
jgi:hypothetical protein